MARFLVFLLTVLAFLTFIGYRLYQTPKLELNVVNWTPSQDLINKFNSQPVIFKGGLEIRNSKTGHFGGLSALWVSATGDRLLTLSDYSTAQYGKGDMGGQLTRSGWFEFQVVYDENLLLKNLVLERSGQVLSDKGNPIPLGIESMARNDDFFFISFDHKNSLAAYPITGDGETHPLDKLPAMELKITPDYPYQNKEGIEALAFTNEGFLLAIHEDYPKKMGYRFCWLMDPDNKTSIQLRYKALLDPKAAATLPNGDILVLEKAFLSPATRMRIIRISGQHLQFEHLTSHQELSGEVLVDITSDELDNFEGMATFARGHRNFCLLISDNNGDWDKGFEGRNRQKTLLLLLELVD